MRNWARPDNTTTDRSRCQHQQQPLQLCASTMTAHSEILSWLTCVTSDPPHSSNRADDDNLDCLNPKPDQADTSAPLSSYQCLSTTDLVSHLLSPPEATPSDTAILPLPKRSLMSDSGAPTPKRLRHGIIHTRDERDDSGYGHENQSQENGTPKASGRVRRKSPTKLSATVSSAFSSRSSQISDRSGSGSRSPTKRIATMELQPDGVETRSFSLTDSRLPDSLVDLLADMEACGRGIGVVSRALEVRSSSTPALPSPT